MFSLHFWQPVLENVSDAIGVICFLRDPSCLCPPQRVYDDEQGFISDR